MISHRYQCNRVQYLIRQTLELLLVSKQKCLLRQQDPMFEDLVFLMTDQHH